VLCVAVLPGCLVISQHRRACMHAPVRWAWCCGRVGVGHWLRCCPSLLRCCACVLLSCCPALCLCCVLGSGCCVLCVAVCLVVGWSVCPLVCVCAVSVCCGACAVSVAVGCGCCLFVVGFGWSFVVLFSCCGVGVLVVSC